MMCIGKKTSYVIIYKKIFIYTNHFGAINRAAVAIVIAPFHHSQLNFIRYAIMHILSSVINVLFSPLDACMFPHTVSCNWLYFSFTVAEFQIRSYSYEDNWK